MNFGIYTKTHIVRQNLTFYFSVSIAEVERLWVRFQQMGCNDDGDLTEDAMKKASYNSDVFMRNVCYFAHACI